MSTQVCVRIGLLALAGSLALGWRAYPAARAADPMPQLLFTSNRAGNNDIFLINADGSGAKNLTNNPADDNGGTWSPDGKKIAFTSNRSGNLDIWMMDADGSNPKQLTRVPAADRTPAWSPDGKKIAFASDRSGNAEVWVMDADGSNPANVTSDPAYDADPAWSADGQRILFASDRMGQQYRLFSMNASGGGVRLLPAREGAGFGGLYPACEPGGKRIAYAEAVNEDREIFVCDAEGQNKKPVTHQGGINLFPSWSSDGKQIAYQHHDNLQAAGSLWITDPAGSVQNQVVGAECPLEGGRPAWKPGH